MCYLDLSETNKGGLGFSSNLSMMARDLWWDETRVWLGLPGYPHLHFPGDWYIPPPHTSGPIRARVDKHWPIRGQYGPLCCQQVPGPEFVWEYGPRFSVVTNTRIPVWDDEIKHSQMGLHFSRFLIIRMKPEPQAVYFLLSDISMANLFNSWSFVAWTILTNYFWIFQLSNVWYIHCLRSRSNCLMHICHQMSRISCIFLFNQTF